MEARHFGHLTAQGLVSPEPKKRPKSSYIRFAAEQPNETWQSEFTHYRLTGHDGGPGADVEILSWIGYQGTGRPPWPPPKK